MSRLGEWNPRPTHYENSRHRIHDAHRTSMHVKPLTMLIEVAGRTPFHSTNGSTFDLVESIDGSRQCHVAGQRYSPAEPPRTSTRRTLCVSPSCSSVTDQVCGVAA